MDKRENWKGGGTRLPASEHEEDFEVDQGNGSCAYQCFMALIRHEIMQMPVATSLEREACYKQIKAYMFSEYLRFNEAQLDEATKKQLPMIREKLEAERSLMEIASQEESMREAIESFKRLSEGAYAVGRNLAYDCNDSFLDRYSLLRWLSKQFFQDIIKNNCGQICTEIPKIPVFGLLLHRLKYFNLRLTHNYLRYNPGFSNDELVEFVMKLYPLRRNPNISVQSVTQV